MFGLFSKEDANFKRNRKLQKLREKQQGKQRVSTERALVEQPVSAEPVNGMFRFLKGDYLALGLVVIMAVGTVVLVIVEFSKMMAVWLNRLLNLP